MSSSSDQPSDRPCKRREDIPSHRFGLCAPRFALDLFPHGKICKIRFVGQVFHINKDRLWF
jgi:hypothetical protein